MISLLNQTDSFITLNDSSTQLDSGSRMHVMDLHVHGLTRGNATDIGQNGQN